MKFLINICSLIILLFGVIACGGCKFVKSSVISPKPDKESTQKIADYSSYSVASIACGEDIITNAKTFILFGDYKGNIQNQSLSSLNFSGWNHTANGSATEWRNLKLNGKNYNFNDKANANSSCNGAYTLDMILLKKIADWNHQHSNGFECNILSQGCKFGDIKNLVFDLKINSAKTHIPTIENIKKIYAAYVNESVVDALDDGKVNIGITLGDNTNLNASIIFQLDQTVLSDKWVRVTIPMNKLSFYQEINYKQTPKTKANLNDIVINRMLIVGETKSGAVLRRNINPWNANIPEIFKEMDVSFKKIEFQLK